MSRRRVTCSDSLAVALRVHPLLAGDPPRVQDGARALKVCKDPVVLPVKEETRPEVKEERKPVVKEEKKPVENVVKVETTEKARKAEVKKHE